MKGRSINKLLRQVDVWHQELTGLEDVELGNLGVLWL